MSFSFNDLFTVQIDEIFKSLLLAKTCKAYAKNTKVFFLI